MYKGIHNTNYVCQPQLYFWDTVLHLVKMGGSLSKKKPVPLNDGYKHFTDAIYKAIAEGKIPLLSEEKEYTIYIFQAGFGKNWSVIL